jgi:hypothetical protein
MNFDIDTADFFIANFCAAAKAYLSCLRNASTNSITNYHATPFWKNMFERNQCQTL